VAYIDTKPSSRVPFGRCMVAILEMLIKDINQTSPGVQIMETQGRRRIGEFFQRWNGGAIMTSITVDIDVIAWHVAKGQKDLLIT